MISGLDMIWATSEVKAARKQIKIMEQYQVCINLCVHVVKAVWLLVETSALLRNVSKPQLKY